MMLFRVAFAAAAKVSKALRETSLLGQVDSFTWVAFWTKRLSDTAAMVKPKLQKTSAAKDATRANSAEVEVGATTQRKGSQTLLAPAAVVLPYSVLVPLRTCC